MGENVLKYSVRSVYLKGLMRLFKLFAFDLDGTLLNDAGEISERTLRALAELTRAGAKIAISTGRMIESARGYARLAGINAPAVLYNGAMIYDYIDEREISRARLDVNLAREILRECERMGVYAQAYPGRSYFAEAETKYTRAYASGVGVECEIVGTPLSDWISTDQVKLLAIGEADDMPRAMETLREKFPGVEFMTSNPKYIEIVARGIDKARALSEIAVGIGTLQSEVVAFGDGQNDVSMINWAGAGYCMANALDSVKAQCKNICASNAEDGCAIIIEEMLSQGKVVSA